MPSQLVHSLTFQVLFLARRDIVHHLLLSPTITKKLSQSADLIGQADLQDEASSFLQMISS
jgi:hypothetical protein